MSKLNKLTVFLKPAFILHQILKKNSSSQATIPIRPKRGLYDIKDWLENQAQKKLPEVAQFIIISDSVTKIRPWVAVSHSSNADTEPGYLQVDTV